MICFTLSMPGRNTWNGKWSGDGELYAIVRNIKGDKAKEILGTKRYYYNFGDGWCACVEAEEITGRQAAGIRRKSIGFCSYDWMVESIIRNGKIITRDKWNV